MLARRWQLTAIVYLSLLAASVTYGTSLGMLLSQQLREADRERQRLLITLDHRPALAAAAEARWLATHPRPYQANDRWLSLFRAHGAWWLAGITFGVYVLWMSGALWDLELRRSYTRRPASRTEPPREAQASPDRSYGIW